MENKCFCFFILYSCIILPSVNCTSHKTFMTLLQRTIIGLIWVSTTAFHLTSPTSCNFLCELNIWENLMLTELHTSFPLLLFVWQLNVADTLSHTGLDKHLALWPVKLSWLSLELAASGIYKINLSMCRRTPGVRCNSHQFLLKRTLYVPYTAHSLAPGSMYNVILSSAYYG